MLTDLNALTDRVGSNDGEGRGGKRPGAGRPKGTSKSELAAKAAAPGAKTAGLEVRTVEQIFEEGLPPKIPMSGDSDAGAIDFALLENPGLYYATGKARKEMAHAAKAELEFRIKDGQYLPREKIRGALAEAYQAVAQALRSIPDNLERKLGITPELAEVVSSAIDDAMGELAYAMEQIHVSNDERNNTD